MAKEKVKAKSPVKAKKVVESGSNEIVLNLDSFIVPLSIVLAGIIIAGAIFFTNKGTSGSNLGDTDSNNPAAEQEDFPPAETTIVDAPYIGDKSKAKVAIVEFNDYQCSFCQRHDQETKDEIVKNYIDTGKAIYVFREFPLDFHGQIAVDSANAALCVNEIAGIDAFLKFHSDAFLIASNDDLTKIAQDLGVDMNKYNTCVAENRYQADIDKGLADGISAGVQGTPGFVVGVLDKDGNVKGKLVAGAYPYDLFSQIIEEMLK